MMFLFIFLFVMQNGWIVKILMCCFGQELSLNILENIWEILACRVFASEWQFKDVGSLLEVVLDCWNTLTNKYFETLCSFWQESCIKVLEKKGEVTKY